MRPRFTSAVVRGLLAMAEQAQIEEGRTTPDRRATDQRDRDRALEYLVATCAYRGLEWDGPASIPQDAATVRSLVVTSEDTPRERKGNALPEVGSLWEEVEGDMRYLVRSVTLTRTLMDPPLTATACLRLTGGTTKTVTPAEWRRMVHRLREVRGTS